MPLACAPESSAATAHNHMGRRRPIALCLHSAPRGASRGRSSARQPGSRLHSRHPQRACLAAWSCAAAASRRVAGATRGWGRAGEAEAGSARISINLEPRRELRQPLPRCQPPGPSSELTPEGPRANTRLKKKRAGRMQGAEFQEGPQICAALGTSRVPGKKQQSLETGLPSLLGFPQTRSIIELDTVVLNVLLAQWYCTPGPGPGMTILRGTPGNPFPATFLQ